MSTIPSTCFYLLGEEPSALYPNKSELRSYFTEQRLELPPGQKQPKRVPIFSEKEFTAFVNETLETLARVTHHLIATNPSSFFLFDPLIKNACHDCGVAIAGELKHMQTEVQHLGSEKAQELFERQFQQAKEAPSDRRIVYLAYLLSHTLNPDPQLQVSVVNKALHGMGQARLSPKLENFIRDTQGFRTKAAGKQLEQLMSQLSRKNSGNVSPELCRLKRFQETPIVFTLLAFFQGDRQSFIHASPQVEKLDDTHPVVVVELICSEQPYAEFREVAKRCSAYGRRFVNQNLRHPDTESCAVCRGISGPESLAMQQIGQRFSQMCAKTQELCTALLLTSEESTQIETVKHFIHDFGLFEHFTSSSPYLTAVHAHVDMKSTAINKGSLLAAPYLRHCEDRGLL